MRTDPYASKSRKDLPYERENGRYVLEYDPDGTAALTTTIVHGLATITGIDVSQGEFSLYDSVDPDALERLFAPKADGSRRRDGHVAFSALDHEVYVHADGAIHVYPPEDARPE